MSLPKDPFMLYSVINTKLRDKYPSLDELCAAEGADRDEICTTLRSAGFEYDSGANKFC